MCGAMDLSNYRVKKSGLSFFLTRDSKNVTIIR